MRGVSIAQGHLSRWPSDGFLSPAAPETRLVTIVPAELAGPDHNSKVVSWQDWVAGQRWTTINPSNMLAYGIPNLLGI